MQQLERQGEDLQTKLEELQDVNQIYRNKDAKREESMRGMQDQIDQIQKMMTILMDAKRKERGMNESMNHFHLMMITYIKR